MGEISLKLVKLAAGDVALIVNDALVAAAEPGLDDTELVELAAQRLAEALCQPLTVLDLPTPDVEDWSWDDVIEDLSIIAAHAAGTTPCQLAP